MPVPDVEFVLPILPRSWNKLIFNKGASTWDYKEWRDNCRVWILTIKNDPAFKKLVPPLEIKFIYGFPDDRVRDVDALCTKPIIDALVFYGILEDDHKKILTNTSNDWEYTAEEQVRVVLCSTTLRKNQQESWLKELRREKKKSQKK